MDTTAFQASILTGKTTKGRQPGAGSRPRTRSRKPGPPRGSRDHRGPQEVADGHTAVLTQQGEEEAALAPKRWKKALSERDQRKRCLSPCPARLAANTRWAGFAAPPAGDLAALQTALQARQVQNKRKDQAAFPWTPRWVSAPVNCLTG